MCFCPVFHFVYIVYRSAVGTCAHRATHTCQTSEGNEWNYIVEFDFILSLRLRNRKLKRKKKERKKKLNGQTQKCHPKNVLFRSNRIYFAETLSIMFVSNTPLPQHTKSGGEQREHFIKMYKVVKFSFHWANRVPTRCFNRVVSNELRQQLISVNVLFSRNGIVYHCLSVFAFRFLSHANFLNG